MTGVSFSNYTTDIDDQPANNFRYDSIGNMISDSLSDIRNIDWTMYGKIATIYKQPRVLGDAISIEYRYDPLGNRVSKRLNKYSDRNEYVWYVRDMQGKVMAVYNMKYNWDHSFGLFKLIDHHIYDSSRLGIIQREQDMISAMRWRSMKLAIVLLYFKLKSIDGGFWRLFIFVTAF